MHYATLFNQSSFHNVGINYWLKSKLLGETDIGEYGQFWLGAVSEVSAKLC